MTTLIDYNRDLTITNLDQLPRGTGAPYLEVLPTTVDGREVLIAKRWARRIANRGNATYIRFTN